MERERTSLFSSGAIRGFAILFATFLIAALIPFIGPLVLIMTPLPILYYRFRLGAGQGIIILALVLSTVFTILTALGYPRDMVVLAAISFTGIVLSETLIRHYTIEKSVALASLTLFFCGVAFLLSYAFRIGILPWRVVELHVAGVIRENLRFYEQLNISAEQVTLIRENASEIGLFFTGIFPALTLSGSVLIVWLNVLAGRSLLRNVPGDFPDFGDLSLWKAPEKLVWLFIISGGVTLMPSEMVSLVGLNLLIICCLFYLLQGLSITSFFFRQKRVPSLFRWLFYFLIVVQHYMLILVIVFGLFDLWIDFRKRITKVTDVHA